MFYSFLFIFILLFSSSSSPFKSWCLLGSKAIITAHAQGVTQNVSTDAIAFQPSNVWNGQQTDTPGASVTYICTQACTGIIITGSQPEGQTGQFSICLDCINAPPGSSPNLTAGTVFNPTFQFAVENLPPALHTLQVVTHSTTPFNVDDVQVILAFPSSSDSSNHSGATNTTSSTTSSTSTSTSTSTSASASASTNSTSSASSSSSSSHSSSVAIAVAVVLLVLALLTGIALYFYRRRRAQQQNGGISNGGNNKWGKGFAKMISWPRPSVEEPVGPASPMLETFRTSRNLDMEAGYGGMPTGLYRSGTTVSRGEGPPAYAVTMDDAMSTGAIPEGGQQTNRGPNAGTGTGTISTRASQPSLYSSYSDPWEDVDENYFNSDDGGADSDSSGQGHTYLDPKKSSSSPTTSSKRERLKANLQIPTRTLSTRSKKSVRSTRTRDTRVSSFQTPAAVKNMLSELNNAIRGNADRFAWKKSMPPVPALPSAYADQHQPDMPMKSLAPPATEVRGHRPTRSTDVLI